MERCGVPANSRAIGSLSFTTFFPDNPQNDALQSVNDFFSTQRLVDRRTMHEKHFRFLAYAVLDLLSALLLRKRAIVDEFTQISACVVAWQDVLTK